MAVKSSCSHFHKRHVLLWFKIMKRIRLNSLPNKKRHKKKLKRNRKMITMENTTKKKDHRKVQPCLKRQSLKMTFAKLISFTNGHWQEFPRINPLITKLKLNHFYKIRLIREKKLLRSIPSLYIWRASLMKLLCYPPKGMFITSIWFLSRIRKLSVYTSKSLRISLSSDQASIISLWWDKNALSPSKNGMKKMWRSLWKE